MSETKLPDTDTDITPEEHYSRPRALVTALLKWLECEFFGLFICLSVIAMRVVMHTAADVIFGAAGLVCYIVVLSDFGLKQGAKARVKNQIRGDNVRPIFGFLLGIVSQLPAAAGLAVFALSSSLPAFKIMNTGLWGIIDLFAPTMRTPDIRPALWAVYPLLLVLQAAAVGICFVMGLNNEDLATKIIYKKQE